MGRERSESTHSRERQAEARVREHSRFEIRESYPRLISNTHKRGCAKRSPRYRRRMLRGILLLYSDAKKKDKKHRPGAFISGRP